MIHISIPLPDELKNNLTRLQLPIVGARWLDSYDLNFTLHNLGNINGADLKDLLQELAQFTHPQIQINISQFEVSKIGEVFIKGDDSLKSLKDKLSRLIKVQDKTPVRILMGYLPIKNNKAKTLFLENAAYLKYSFVAESLTILEWKGHFTELARFKLDPLTPHSIIM